MAKEISKLGEQIEERIRRSKSERIEYRRNELMMIMMEWKHQGNNRKKDSECRENVNVD